MMKNIAIFQGLPSQHTNIGACFMPLFAKLSMRLQKEIIQNHTLLGTNIWVLRDFTPKMDGEHNGKPYEQMDDLGGKIPLFLVPHPCHPFFLKGLVSR